jgi:hypothetical protein
MGICFSLLVGFGMLREIGILNVLKVLSSQSGIFQASIVIYDSSKISLFNKSLKSNSYNNLILLLCKF